MCAVAWIISHNDLCNLSYATDVPSLFEKPPIVAPLMPFWFPHYILAVTSLTLVHVSQGFRHSPRHARRSAHVRVTEEKPILAEVPEAEPDSAAGLRKRKVKKRVLPEFYQSVQVTPTRKPVGTHFTVTMADADADAALCLLTSTLTSCVLATGL